MAGRRKPRPANVEAAKRYKMEDRYRKNRILRLQRHLKEYPEDEQASNALERIEAGNLKYRRKKPIKKLTASEKEMHRLKKLAKNTHIPEPKVPEWKLILAEAFGRKAPKITVKKRRHVKRV